MAKQSGMLKRQKEEQKARDRVLQDATRQTFVQYMTDTLLFTLNDPEVMGKDVFGYARLKKILDAWGAKYDLYFEALTLADEADYYRQKTPSGALSPRARTSSRSRSGINGCP